jgi:hypothetical protein
LRHYYSSGYSLDGLPVSRAELNRINGRGELDLLANITSTSFGVYLGSHYSYRDRSGSTLNNLSQETAFAWQRETRGEITETRFWLVSNIWSSFITRIPPQQVKATLTGDRLKKYDVERNKTRNKLQNSEKCRNFLIAHGIDPDQALDAVNLQRAFDGANSTISRLNAGVVPPEVDLTTKTGQAYANASISVEFTNKRGSKIQAHTAFYVGGGFQCDSGWTERCLL